MMCMSVCVYLYRVILLQQPLPDYMPFFLFYKMVMMFSIVILILIAVGTNETFEHYILQSNFL